MAIRRTAQQQVGLLTVFEAGAVLCDVLMVQLPESDYFRLQKWNPLSQKSLQFSANL